MKVIAINGSPKKEGNTYHALNIVGSKLNENEIDFEIIHVGNKLIRGCIACGKCGKEKNEQCAITNDPVNEWIKQMKTADGIILGSPVYYAGIAGTMKCFLDRAFYVSTSNNNLFRHKIGAALTAVRRTGGSVTFDNLNHYLTYSEMIIASSNYWNVIHGRTPGEIEHDDEGKQILEVLGNNMAWLIKMREQTKGSLPEPAYINKIATNFIR